MRSDRERLLDMLEAIEHIRRYSARGREAFEQDELIQAWIIYHLQILGEAAAGLSTERRTQDDDVWRPIIGMRNILVHRYFGIDNGIVWAVVENALSPLEAHIRLVLEQFEDKP
jgi:uncharacterized protein with HEPN domain